MNVRSITLSIHLRRLRIAAMFLAFAGCGAKTGVDPWMTTSDASIGFDASDANSSCFVAVGTNGTIVRSPDGVAWTLVASGTTNDLFSIANGNSHFVAVGEAGATVTSADGISWNAPNPEAGTQLVYVSFVGEKFVAVGGESNVGALALTSFDGDAWTAIESPTNYAFNAIARRGRTMIVSGDTLSAVGGTRLFVSTLSEGSTASGWNEREGPAFYDGTTVGDEILAVGHRSVFTSSDGVVWNESRLDSPQYLTGVASNGSTRVVVGERGARYSSTNGVDWIDRATGDDVSLNDVAYGAGRFVAFGRTRGASGESIVMTSDDGETWTRHSLPTRENLYDVAYGSRTE